MDIKNGVFNSEILNRLGVPSHNSISADIEVVEHHSHNSERWFGKSENQAGSDWAADNLSPFIVRAGSNVYGAEEKLIGLGDLPLITNASYYDPHRIFVSAVSNDILYKMRLIYGSGINSDGAETAGSYSEVIVKFDALNPQQTAGVPFDVRIPRLNNKDQLWAKVKAQTSGATISLLVGAHTYEV